MQGGKRKQIEDFFLSRSLSNKIFACRERELACVETSVRGVRRGIKKMGLAGIC